jgi:uncharacterized protein
MTHNQINKSKTNMNLTDQINNDIKTAMLAKDASKLEALRAIKSALLLLKTSPEGQSEATELKALQKMVKQRKETADVYIGQGRQELADVELAQAAVIETYLPKQMGEDELKAILQNIITTVGAFSPADMGKVMGAATKELSGKADGSVISKIVRELLSK